MKNRTTSDKITSLEEGQIFVFGSNTRDTHGKGAAKTALSWGAIHGQAEGLQGKTYGIPTVGNSMSHTLELKKIEKYVSQFIDFAEANPHLTFLVTEIGCGLAKLKVKQVAPLFMRAVYIENIHLPQRFWRRLI